MPTCPHCGGLPLVTNIVHIYEPPPATPVTNIVNTVRTPS